MHILINVKMYAQSNTLTTTLLSIDLIPNHVFK